MHIKNLLANSAIQNRINQQQQQQQPQFNNPTTNTISNTIQNNLTSNSIQGATATTTETGKIRKRKNNSINSKLIGSVNQHQSNQKENTHNSSNMHSMLPANGANSAEQNALRLFEQFKNMGMIQMSQPYPNVAQFSVNWPGKQHSGLLKKSNHIKGHCFDLEVEHLTNASYQMDKKFIDYILSESGIFSQEGKGKDESALLAIKSNVSKDGKLRELKNCFRVYGAKMEKPAQPLAEIDKNHLVKSSSHRIRDILNLSGGGGGEDKFKEEELINTSKQAQAEEQKKKVEYAEYLKKQLKVEVAMETTNGNVKLESNTDEDNQEPMSPVIGLERAMPKIEPTDLDSVALDDDDDGSSKENGSHGNNQTSVTLKLSKKACENIKETLNKVSDLMLMSCPSQWDLGKMVVVNNETKPELEASNNNVEPAVTPAKQLDLPPVTPVASLNVKATAAVTETSYSVTSLANSLCFKTCKFCEAYLVDGKLQIS